MNPIHIGGIEAGGTKFVCGFGPCGAGTILKQITIPTGEPETTMQQVVDFFRSAEEPLSAIGIGSFGPVQLDPASPQFGYITSTPKLSWRYFDICGYVRRALGVRVAIDTDVNAAALAEAQWGAATDAPTSLYITVGTGVGGGAITGGKVLHGLSHPEMGHIRVPHNLDQDPFPGACPYHRDCLEGLVAGYALQARWEISPVELPDDHPAWTLQVEYLAAACVNWISTLMPHRVVLGGGLMRPHLFPAIRGRVQMLLNGYLDFPEFSSHGLENYILPSALGGRAGLLGAFSLAEQSLSLKTT